MEGPYVTSDCLSCTRKKKRKTGSSVYIPDKEEKKKNSNVPPTNPRITRENTSDNGGKRAKAVMQAPSVEKEKKEGGR